MCVRRYVIDSFATMMCNLITCIVQLREVQAALHVCHASHRRHVRHTRHDQGESRTVESSFLGANGEVIKISFFYLIVCLTKCFLLFLNDVVYFLCR